jgi:hypothetical protein
MSICICFYLLAGIKALFKGEFIEKCPIMAERYFS